MRTQKTSSTNSRQSPLICSGTPLDKYLEQNSPTGQKLEEHHTSTARAAGQSASCWTISQLRNWSVCRPKKSLAGQRKWSRNFKLNSQIRPRCHKKRIRSWDCNNTFITIQVSHTAMCQWVGLKTHMHAANVQPHYELWVKNSSLPTKVSSTALVNFTWRPGKLPSRTGAQTTAGEATLPPAARCSPGSILLRFWRFFFYNFSLIGAWVCLWLPSGCSGVMGR